MPEPCQKIHYDDLPYDSIKRPCHLCQKPVYDFRDKDEKFLAEVWKKHQGDFCGAFTYDQFEKHYPSPVSILTKLKAAVIAYVVTFLSFSSRGQTNEDSLTYKPEIVHVTDTTDNSFQVFSKKGWRKRDSGRINIKINNVYYNSIGVQDSDVVFLPAHVRRGDLITIEESRTTLNKGFYKQIKKTKKVEFVFGEKNEVEVQFLRKRRLRIIYRRDFIGCPKFR